MPKQLQTKALLQVPDLPVQDLRGSVKIEEGKNSGMSKVKKKISEKDQKESMCQKKKKREVGNSCQVLKKPSVKM